MTGEEGDSKEFNLSHPKPSTTPMVLKAPHFTLHSGVNQVEAAECSTDPARKSAEMIRTPTSTPTALRFAERTSSLRARTPLPAMVLPATPERDSDKKWGRQTHRPSARAAPLTASALAGSTVSAGTRSLPRPVQDYKSTRSSSAPAIML